MSRADKTIVGFATIWAAVFVAYGSHRTPLLNIPSFLLTLLFAVTALFSFGNMLRRWRQEGRAAARPFLICIVLFIMAMLVISPIRRALFAWALPSYESVVAQIASGHIPASGSFGSLPDAVPRSRMTWQVWQEKTADGVLMVEFDTERSFPVLHSAYLYSSSGNVEPGSHMAERWKFRHKLRDHWFFVSD